MDLLKDKKFDSKVVNLSDLNEYSFSIPTYQRPYVWGDEELKKLLDDFYTSFTNDSEAPYYISTILTREQNKLAEVIDGQQRFTTLWLISFVISQLDNEGAAATTEFLKNGEGLRLVFEIRDEVTSFLNNLLNEDNTTKKIYDEEFIEKHPYLKNIAKGLVFINSYIEQLPEDEILDFSNYIYNNVYLIKNSTPEKTDLNKLFSTINSAGVQLEQTDIVKANLLNLINKDKVMFSKIWESCENMNNFFERNARESFSASNWDNINLVEKHSFLKEPSSSSETDFKYKMINEKETTEDSSFSIDTINIDFIPAYEQDKKHYEDESDRKSEVVYCRSIINFSQLLLHTYRIHLKEENLLQEKKQEEDIKKYEDFEGEFHEKRLIDVFKEMQIRNDSEEIKRFFYRLWDVRYLFDRYVIKWISDSEDKTESLEMVRFSKNPDSYYNRDKREKTNSLMLQSVLYFTGDYYRQYWLSVYLNFLYENQNNNKLSENERLIFLERVDNIFSLTTTVTDKHLSWMLMNGSKDFEVNDEMLEGLKNYLNLSNGTGFYHYWFQKLEYILWKNWGVEKSDKFKNYRVTSRNSIEHIYPQNPEIENIHPNIEDEFLHSFGNLVLMSVSQNSEYSNKPYKVKRSMFEEKNSYDTLKSYYIFQNNKWNSELIEKHCKEMIDKIIEHYNHGN